MGPRGGVGSRVSGSSSGSLQLDLGSGGGEGLGETAVCLVEGGAGVADGDGHELHLSPERLEFVDEGGRILCSYLGAACRIRSLGRSRSR